MKSASATATAFPVSMKGEAFPMSMKGQRVRVCRPYFECSVSSLERRVEDEHSFTLLELKSSIEFPPLSVGEKLLLEGHGLRCDCSVHSREEGVFVSVQDCQVRPCSACASLELPMPVPLLPDGFKDKTVRFSRLGSQNIMETEAMVTEIERCRPSLSIVHLGISAASPPLCMGDLLVLESLDGQLRWETDVRSDGQWEVYGEEKIVVSCGNENNSISVHVRTGEANRYPRLLPQESMAILVWPVPNSDPLTDNGRGAALRKASKATVNETHIAKPKIKIGIDGYGSIGSAIARIVLESEDMELVAINDSNIPMDLNCMFRDRHDQWLSSFKMKDEDPNTFMFGGKEVTIFRVKEPDKIPWSKVGAEYFVEARVNQSSADYYKNRTGEYKDKRHTDMSSNVTIFRNHLSPFAKILHDRFGMVEDVVTGCRAPVLYIKLHNSNAAKAIGEVLPHWKGNQDGMIFQVPAVDALPIDLTIKLAGYEEYQLISSDTKPSSGFCMLLAWCVEMTHQISQVSYCELNYGVPEVRYYRGRKL